MVNEILSTGSLAREVGTDVWRVRRIFEDGDVAEAPRLGPYRMIPRERVPEIQNALRKRGWLVESEDHSA